MEKLREYKNKKGFDETFIEPMLTIRTHTRITLSDLQKTEILSNIFNW